MILQVRCWGEQYSRDNCKCDDQFCNDSNFTDFNFTQLMPRWSYMLTCAVPRSRNTSCRQILFKRVNSTNTWVTSLIRYIRDFSARAFRDLGTRTKKKSKNHSISCQSCCFVEGLRIDEMTNKPGSKSPREIIVKYPGNADNLQSQSPSARQSVYDTKLKKPALRSNGNNASLQRVSATLRC